MTWPGSKANLKSIWLKYIKVADHYKIWSEEEKTEISWVRLNSTECGFFFFFFCTGSSFQVWKMSAYSQDDFSRSTAASHHSRSLLHVQHAVHPARTGLEGKVKVKKREYFLSHHMVALSLLEERNCAVFVNCWSLLAVDSCCSSHLPAALAVIIPSVDAKLYTGYASFCTSLPPPQDKLS